MTLAVHELFIVVMFCLTNQLVVLRFSFEVHKKTGVCNWVYIALVTSNMRLKRQLHLIRVLHLVDQRIKCHHIHKEKDVTLTGMVTECVPCIASGEPMSAKAICFSI